MNIKDLMLSLNDKPIALFPAYIRLTGDHATACVLSQLLYWHGKMNGKQFYKTNDELMDECILTKEQMKRVKACLKKLPFVLIERKGNPCRTFYDFDYDLLAEMLADLKKSKCESTPPTSRGENTPSSRCQNPPTSRGENTPSIIQETTTETTTDIKKHTKRNDPSLSFETFYDSYPKKVGKKDANKAWTKIKDKDRLLILAAIANQKLNNPQWVKGEKQFIKAPAAWLNQECWEDEFDAVVTFSSHTKLADKTQSAAGSLDSFFNNDLNKLNTLSAYKMEEYHDAAIQNK